MRDILVFAGLIVFVIIPFRIFVAQPYIVDGWSMDPTFRSGEYLIVDQISFRLREPVRGEVVVFKYPKDPRKYFIKRIIGLPGETVIIKEGVVSVVDAEGKTLSLNEPFVAFFKNDDNAEYVLGRTEFFVMGDNRIGSADSRLWGALPEQNIVGRPLFSLFPVSRISVLPGDASKTIVEDENH